MENYMDNNKIALEGRVVTTPLYSHELYGEVFYIFDLEVERLSDSKDILSITISERLLSDFEINLGEYLKIDGQLRSYNKLIDNRNKLVLTVFARSIEVPMEKQRDPNEIILDGFICKQPIYRKTPFGREITDLLIAVNRAYNKSDYIPVIAWGRNARFSKDFSVGARIRVTGRLQSREYVKNISETEKITRVAYEVSISKLELLSDIEAEMETALEKEPSMA